MTNHPRFDITEISVCTVCIHLLANGEYNDGTDTAEVVSAGMERIWGADLRHMVPGGSHESCEPSCDGSGDCFADDLGFSWSSCDGCGDTDGGDRHRATVMIPNPKWMSEPEWSNNV